MNNFYGGGYNPYQQSYPQTYPQNNMYQQPMNRPQTQQLAFVSGIEGAKAYIVAPNQTIYLKDSDSDMLWVKSADMQGKYYMQCYVMKPYENLQQSNDNQYVSMNDFNGFRNDFEERLNKLSIQVENLPRTNVSKAKGVKIDE